MSWNIFKTRFLRPPGARPEAEFLARCLHCGQCVDVCPYGCITVRMSLSPFRSGTPQIDPQLSPCYLCMRCCSVCPSEALENVSIDKVKMGEARLEKGKCHTWEGFILCRSCFERCPLKGNAIVLEKGMYPVITEKCAGCGICEHVCPTRAITTMPSRYI